MYIYIHTLTALSLMANMPLLVFFRGRTPPVTGRRGEANRAAQPLLKGPGQELFSGAHPAVLGAAPSLLPTAHPAGDRPTGWSMTTHPSPCSRGLEWSFYRVLTRRSLGPLPGRARRP